MFFIIGGDGREYGPATAEQVRGWIQAGRANLETKAKALGSEEWRRLGDYAEFGAPDSPPPLPGVSASAPSVGTFTTPVAVPAELAGVGARTGAALFNAFIYFLSLMPGSMAMARGLLEKNPQLAKGGIPHMEDLDLTGFAEGVVWVWAGLGLALLLQALLIGVRGQNLGKLLVGARVVRVDTGAPAGFLRGAVLRFALPVSIVFLLNLAFPLGFVFLVVDYCFIFRQDRRCLHDLIAGTRVVRT
ncbi:MAG: RDD family protein [Verrucomicrobia bacterium]|nr:RDD family protein [Verrucomicrobiota bacterium]